MAISILGTNTSATTTCTVTAHSIGDCILVLAARKGSNGTPTVPTGYTAIQSVTSNSAGSVMAYKIATSTSDASGTWSNATDMVISVYTGTNTSAPIGGSNVQTGTAATTITYPAVIMTNSSGSSWVAGLGNTHSTNTTIGTAPTGMTNRGSENTNTTVSGNDTNGGVTSWSSTNQSIGGTAGQWGCYTAELLASGGGPPVTNSGFFLLL